MAGFSLEPSLTNTVFNPDQLIAGSHDLVTDSVIIASGQVLTRGTLIGQQTSAIVGSTATAATVAGGANTGNGTIGSITIGPEVMFGTYRVTMTTATAFNVLDPQNEPVGTGTAGTGFTNPQINLTVTAGGTAFVANDGFNIVINEASGAGNGYYIAVVAGATDGSELAENWAILAEDTNTSSTGTNAATTAPVYINGEFDPNYMTLGTGLNAAGIKTALRQAGSGMFIKSGAITNLSQ
jgi:hypothetical protein